MIKQIEIMRKKKFVVVVLDTNNITFVFYVVTPVEPTIMLIYSSREIKVFFLTSMDILVKYLDFLHIFSSNSMAKLLKYTRMNNYSINLLEDKQLLYSSIYSLKPLELMILRTYIKTNLVSSFIRSSESLTSTPISFI